MKTFLLATGISFLSAIGAYAQNIQGRLLQADGNPAQYATVTLHQATDSTLVKGALSGEDGVYQLMNLKPGRYFLKCTQLGFADLGTAAFDFDGTDKTLPDQQFAPADNKLKEVTVSARKMPVEVKADKTILNVEGTVNSTGLNALELLRKAPGVTVDNNENLSVKGKNNVRIMIDGRETPLDGKDLAAFLKGTQASDIANIEIITNPSAKYDAAGNAGIINIKLKKNKAYGTNGNVGAEFIQGITPKAGMNLSLNHRNKNLNLFGAYNNHFGDWHNDNFFVREQNGQVFDQTATQFDRSRWNSARIGADWSLNSKHTIGVLLNGSINPNSNWYGSSQTSISNISKRDSITQLLFAGNTIENDRSTLNSNLNYRFADTSGRSLNIDVDYGIYRFRAASNQPNTYRTADGETVLQTRNFRNNTPTDINISTAKADYEQPLWKGVLGLGAKFANVETDNTFDFYNVQGGTSILDTTVSNRFKYKEQTSAAYINYNRMFGKKLNVQAGLRLEHTEYMGDLIAYTRQDVNKVESSYTELFPSAALTYTFTKKLGLNATYSRRIDRPSYQDLNPFEFKMDELTFQRGNPRLRPQFTNSFEIAPTWQGYPIVSIGYSHTKDVFTQVLDTDDDNPNATFITQENIADQKNWTATLNIPTPVAKWWDGFISVTGFKSTFKANFDNLGFGINEISFTSMNLYAEQNIKLGKGWGVQLSGWFNSPGYWGTFENYAQGAMDFGLRKKILKDKGELRLRVGDILGTAGWNGKNIFTPGLLMTARGNWESQTLTVNFSYRFGNMDVKGARNRKTGLEDEGKRVKR